MAELYLSDGSEFSKIPLLTETVTTDTNLDNHTKTGYYVVRGVPSTGGNASSPVSQWASVFTDADIGTPFQIAIPDGAVSYLYKRALGSSTWKKCLRDMLIQQKVQTLNIQFKFHLFSRRIQDVSCG